MLSPVVNALEFLHAQGYAHGRLKPSNLLVVNDQLKLSGDCIALAAGNAVELAETGAPETSVYAAPELGRGAVTPAVDVWALGMTLVAATDSETRTVGASDSRGTGRSSRDCGAAWTNREGVFAGGPGEEGHARRVARDSRS